MKKLIKSFIVIGFQAVLLSSCVIKQPQEIVETPKTINVTGTWKCNYRTRFNLHKIFSKNNGLECFQSG